MVNQYAVKVIDGNLIGGKTDPLGHGYYRTSVNVHNPQNYRVNFSVKLVISDHNFDGDGSISQWIQTALDQDRSLEFDLIGFGSFNLALPPFLEGWIVIDTENDIDELDVWGVYTGNEANKFLCMWSPGSLATMHMEKAHKRLTEHSEYPG